MFVREQIEILVCNEAVDMRKGADGLVGVVREVLLEEPLSKKLFVFKSKRRDRVKILYWHCNGFAIWSKRVQSGMFNFPAAGNNYSLSRSALRMILEGTDLKTFS